MTSADGKSYVKQSEGMRWCGEGLYLYLDHSDQMMGWKRVRSAKETS